MNARLTTLIIVALVAGISFWDEIPRQGGNAPSPVEPAVITDARSGGTLGTRLTGPVRVVDGDTIRLGAHRIRLHGIDAPESDQACLDPQGASWACGDAATERLSDLDRRRSGVLQRARYRPLPAYHRRMLRGW